MSSYNSVSSAIAKTNDKYFIIEHSDRDGWFLFDVDVDTTPATVIWTKRERAAWAFEEICVAEDYIEEHIQKYRVKICDGQSS